MGDEEAHREGGGREEAAGGATEKRSVAYVVAATTTGHEDCFALCEQFGLDWKKVDVTDNVSGDGDDAPQLHFFELRHRFDVAGAPLNPMEEYDCVIQGRGLTESFLSAALARAGYKVLHLDQSDQYGSAFVSNDLTNVGSASSEEETPAFSSLKFSVDTREEDAAADDQSGAVFAKTVLRRRHRSGHLRQRPLYRLTPCTPVPHGLDSPSWVYWRTLTPSRPSLSQTQHAPSNSRMWTASSLIPNR